MVLEDSLKYDPGRSSRVQYEKKEIFLVHSLTSESLALMVERQY